MVMLNTLAGGRAVSQCRPTGGPLGVQTTFLTVEQVLCGGGVSGGRGWWSSKWGTGPTDTKDWFLRKM